MNKGIIFETKNYDKIDGRNGHESSIKKLTLGKPTKKENQTMKIAAQIWEEKENGELVIVQELPIHQIMDLMLLLSRVLLHFKTAYRLPLLYDPQNLTIDRIGVQGGVLPIEICIDNEDINLDIKNFELDLGNLGEITGERLRRISKILEEMEY